MASEEKSGHSAFSWTAPKGLMIIGLFIGLALISEFCIISFFSYSGLVEASAYPISPLFHLLPLAVILVLVLSWMYLTKQVALKPYKISTVKVGEKRRRSKRSRSKSSQGFLEQIKKVYTRVNAALFSADDNSVVNRRNSFDSIALENVLTILTVFLISLLLIAVVVYPGLFTDFAAGLYGANTALYGFVLGVADTLKGVLEALGPINDLLRGIAPGFRSLFEAIASPKAQHLTSSDILWRYVFCQNAAAWVSAVFALTYTKYFGRITRRI